MISKLQTLASLINYQASTGSGGIRTGLEARGGTSLINYGSVDPVSDFFRASLLVGSSLDSGVTSVSPFEQLMQSLRMPQSAQGTAGGYAVSGRPVNGPVTSIFGHRDVPGLPSNHTGIDFAVPVGTPVRATGDGIVKSAGWENGYGLAVRIEHNGQVQTIYAHNSQLAVQPGDKISKGQVISYSGNTGLSTGPHVHYEVRVSGKPVDPEPYINGTALGGQTAELVNPAVNAGVVQNGGIAEIIASAAARYGIDAGLVNAVVKAESGYNPNAVSRAGAKGLMQLMSQTATSLGVSDPFDPAQNVDGGVRYLKQMLDKYGNVSLALAAYNAGPGAVDKHGGIPPYDETRNYVARVLDYWKGREDQSLREGSNAFTI